MYRHTENVTKLLRQAIYKLWLEFKNTKIASKLKFKCRQIPITTSAHCGTYSYRVTLISDQNVLIFFAQIDTQTQADTAKTLPAFSIAGVQLMNGVICTDVQESCCTLHMVVGPGIYGWIMSVVPAMKVHLKTARTPAGEQETATAATMKTWQSRVALSLVSNGITA